MDVLNFEYFVFVCVIIKIMTREIYLFSIYGNYHTYKVKTVKPRTPHCTGFCAGHFQEIFWIPNENLTVKKY